MDITPTPTVDKVIEIDGEYANERELFLAALADGMTEILASVLVEDFVKCRDSEWAAQQKSEIDAENAWLRAAENAGWEQTEIDRMNGM